MLKLKKQLSSEISWRGKISYQKTELQLQDPSQVEREINKGRVATLSFLALPHAGAPASFHRIPILPLGLSFPSPLGKCPPQDPTPHPGCPHQLSSSAVLSRCANLITLAGHLVAMSPRSFPNTNPSHLSFLETQPSPDL